MPDGVHKLPWHQFPGLPEDRDWLTYGEVDELLRKEGLHMTRDVVRSALAGVKIHRYRVWNMYQPDHVAMIRAAVLAAPPRKKNRRLGGKHSR